MFTGVGGMGVRKAQIQTTRMPNKMDNEVIGTLINSWPTRTIRRIYVFLGSNPVLSGTEVPRVKMI